jgi:hypothetical protein
MTRAKLKLIHSNTQVKRERCIIAEIHRESPQLVDISMMKTRRYLSIENAIPAMTKWMYQYGRVGDVCAIYHDVTGLEIGTLKMNARGVIKTTFIFDDN